VGFKLKNRWWVPADFGFARVGPIDRRRFLRVVDSALRTGALLQGVYGAGRPLAEIKEKSGPPVLTHLAGAIPRTTYAAGAALDALALSHYQLGLMVMTISRLASVYARDRDYIIQPYSWTTTGLRIGTEPIDVLSRDADADELGAVLQRALSAAKDGVAHPTNWKAQLEPLLLCAKVRSWSALQKSAKMCQIETLDGGVRITPSRNGGIAGPDKGYHPIADQAVVLPLDCSNEELGTTVLRALTLCT
jgi:CDI immunity protein